MKRQSLFRFPSLRRKQKPPLLYRNGLTSEPLEFRYVLSAAPVFSEFGSVLSVVFRGDAIDLQADVTDPDGTVAQVDFYRDVDNDGQLTLAIDEFLSSDTNGADGWSHDQQLVSNPGNTVGWLAWQRTALSSCFDAGGWRLRLGEGKEQWRQG